MKKVRSLMGEENWTKYQKLRSSNKAINCRRNKKIKLIRYKGGKCYQCSYDNLDCPSVFDFHHVDPNEKDFNINRYNISVERLKKEVDKCILVCKNCHSEIHEQEYLEKRILRVKLMESLKNV